MNKTCIKHETDETVLGLFKTHHKGSLFAEGGVRRCFTLYYVIVYYIISCDFELDRIISKYIIFSYTAL